MIFDEPLGAHDGFAVPANERFELDTPAVFRDPA
jgi:hypothetical protein